MPLFEVRDLGISFGGIRAVDGVSFSVEAGEVYAIIGPNGAGKTTIFNLVSRIYDPSQGRILFRGQDVTGVPAHRIAGLGIARTFQNINLFENATVLDNLFLGRHAHSRPGLLAELAFAPSVRRQKLADRRRLEEIIDFLDLQHYRDLVIAGLPYGVRKVVELGRALAIEPALLLLDEPSSGLNVEETEDMAYWIQDIKEALGITVLMVEHDLNLVAAVSDRVMAMNNGRVLVEGTAEEVQRHPEVVKAYLGG